MNGAGQKERKVTTAVQRAATYELIARCFAYPDERGLAAMAETAQLAANLLQGELIEALAGEVGGSSADELMEAYARTFTLSASPDFPTYESAYVCTDPAQQTTVMADVAGFYKAFGVEIGEAGFRPDDIAVELEFMGYLCRKEAYALEHLGAPRVSQAGRVERLFLREHLGRWAGALGARLDGAEHPFYRSLGRALSGWLLEEAKGFGAEPIDKVVAPLMPWPRRERASYEPVGAQIFSPAEISVGRSTE